MVDSDGRSVVGADRGAHMHDCVRHIEPVIPALRRFAWALTRDRAAADDLVQDCLERAISRWPQRRADREVRPWLFAILHNLAISRLRELKRRGRPEPLEDAPPGALALPPGQEHRLTHHELVRAVGELPEEQRSVLLLVSVEDLSYAEVAEALQIPIGTVMSRLHRARERLRLALGADGDANARGPRLRRVK
jgi:RNA polymerase sigma factor (sigma-70 family)